MTYWYLLPALAVCIVFSAFFSASEIVFGSVNRLHLNRNAEKGTKKLPMLSVWPIITAKPSPRYSWETIS